MLSVECEVSCLLGGTNEITFFVFCFVLFCFVLLLEQKCRFRKQLTYLILFHKCRTTVDTRPDLLQRHDQVENTVFGFT